MASDGTSFMPLADTTPRECALLSGIITLTFETSFPPLR